MNNFETNYKKLLANILHNGELTSNRTNVKTLSLFNEVLNINLNEGFPIITGKKIFFKKALAEFKWMFEGRTDIEYLNNRNVKWWNMYGKNLGPIYGHQLRKFNNKYDQIKYAINEINNNSRRAVINLWNIEDLKKQVLPCCFTQLNFVRINNKLNLSVHFRSSDTFLGLPYDIIVLGLFLITIANETKLTPNTLGINLANAHIYTNQIDHVTTYLSNKTYSLPFIKGDYNNYELINYISNKFIKTEYVI